MQTSSPIPRFGTSVSIRSLAFCKPIPPCHVDHFMLVLGGAFEVESTSVLLNQLVQA